MQSKEKVNSCLFAKTIIKVNGYSTLTRVSGCVPSALYVLPHLIYTTIQQDRYFHYSLLFKWVNKCDLNQGHKTQQ